jgi:hypothetical protein
MLDVAESAVLGYLRDGMDKIAAGRPDYAIEDPDWWRHFYERVQGKSFASFSNGREEDAG